MTDAPHTRQSRGAAAPPSREEVESYEGESGFVGSTESDTGAARTPLDRRIASLDGIRGLAILLVVVHNAGTVRGELTGLLLRGWSVIANSGWIGVQLFFALSGFLITRILLESKGVTGGMRSFYVRRLLRIAPLYYATLIFLFAIAPHIPPIMHLASTRGHSEAWYWLYLSNWISPWGATVGLPHVWSLAVEEQFYLFWPFLVAALSTRALGYTSIAMIVFAFAARAGLDAILPLHYADEAAYTFTVTRWDAIAFGALVAILVTTKPASWFKPRLVLLGLIGSAVALLGVLGVEHGIASMGMPAEFVSMPVTSFASALLVLCCAVPTFARERAVSWIPRLFSSRALAWVGKYSYAIYVFHMPVHIVLSHYADHTLSHGSPPYQFVLLVAYVTAVFAISAALALISWQLIEQPMLSLKRYFPMPSRTARPVRA